MASTESNISVKDSGTQSPCAKAIRAMYCVDVSNNPRIPILMELVGSVSRANSPQEIYQRFRLGMHKLAHHAGYIAVSTRDLKPGEYKITRMEVDQTGQPSTNDPWSEWDKMTTHTGGFFGELIRGAWPELIHNLDINNDPVLGDSISQFKSLMSIPLFDNGEPLNWAILLGNEPKQFTVDNLEETILRANLIGGLTKNMVISQELKIANERINREVEQIASIQRSLLPDPLPQIEGVEVAASYVTSEKAGGDYFDFFAYNTDEFGNPDAAGRWGVLIADASGHGPSAAVVMAMLHAILHAFPDRHAGPAAILEHANKQLSLKRIEGSFVTAFFGIYDPKDKTLTYARAGHNPPLVKNGEGVKELCDVGGIPLGIDPDWKLEEQTVQLHTNDMLLFYTDGVTEAMDKEGEQFGLEGVERALEVCAGSTQCSIDTIDACVERHQAGTTIKDDQTLVAMRII